MKNSNLRTIQVSIINNIVLAIAIIAVPALIGSVGRFYTIGWQPVFHVHIFLAICIIIISVLRNRLPYRSKVYFILFLFFTLGVAAGVNLGLNGFFLEFLTLLIFLSVVFLSKGKVYFMYFLSIAMIVIVGYFHVTGVLKPEGFKDEYSTFAGSWVNATVAFSTIVAFVIYIAGQIGYLLQESNLKLQEAANTDFLTNCLNRMGFFNVATMEIEKSKRYKYNLNAIEIDIDHFKNINDKYGHIKGDDVLQSVALILKNNIRTSDILARIGGEEFLILTSNINIKQTKILAEKLRKIMESGKVAGIDENVTISLGVAKYSGEDTLQNLMRKADLALYDAKENGRNQVRIFSGKVRANQT